MGGGIKCNRVALPKGHDRGGDLVEKTRND